MVRVAVTGVGIVSPLGLDAPSSWRAALAGESGVGWIGAFDTSGLPVRVAGEVKDFDPFQVASAKEARKLERNVLFALSAGREALADSGLSGFDPTRVGIIFGSAVGGIGAAIRQAGVLLERGPDRVSRASSRTCSWTPPPDSSQSRSGSRGSTTRSCRRARPAPHTIGEAAELIKRGDADAMIAGGTEACIEPV